MNCYTICIHSSQQDYQEIAANFESAVTTGDFVDIEINGRDEELEVFQVVHKIGGKSYLHVNLNDDEVKVAA